MDIETILELMYIGINNETLKKIIKKIETSETYINGIRKCNHLHCGVKFNPQTKTILVNYKKVLEYLDAFEKNAKIDIGNPREYDLRLIKILTAYRILYKEMYYAKQIYNAFETDKTDLETEITRSIYSIDTKDYSNPKRFEQINTINNTLFPYSKINPITRKAEIESIKQVINLMSKIKHNYNKVYNEFIVKEASAKIEGYDKKRIPYLMTLDILKSFSYNYTINLPYNTKSEQELIEKTNSLASEQERLELGLSVGIEEINKQYKKISSILY